MDAIKLLEADHREVEALFKKYEDSEDVMVQAQTAEKICQCLTVHATIEEELFYPKAKKILSKEDEAKLVEHAEKEHALAKAMIAKIMEMETGILLHAAVKALKLAIEHHVKEEETEMFPKLKQLGMETLQLGQDLEQRKMQLKSTM